MTKDEEVRAFFLNVMPDEEIELTWENFARLAYVAVLIERGTLRWTTSVRSASRPRPASRCGCCIEPQIALVVPRLGRPAGIGGRQVPRMVQVCGTTAIGCRD